MVKVYIASSREIGNRCKEWAKENICTGFEITENIDDCEVFVSVLYDKIIKKEFIKNRRCYNFHPGILPEYRGAGCSSWVIINGEKKSGVTLHLIDEGIDTGDIIKINKFDIKESDTAYDVNSNAIETIFKMFKLNFNIILSENYLQTKQDDSCAKTYYRKDLQNLKDITKLIKAFYYPGKEGLYYKNNGTKFYIGENYESN